MWNLSVIFISVFNFHSVMAALHQAKEKMKLILAVYATGLTLFIFYLIFPETFLLASVPKMYFPNYYVPGGLYWLTRIIFQGVIPIYFIFKLIHTYKKTSEFREKNRILYFMISLSLGWGLGIIPPLLIYNIPVDPAYGVIFPIMFAIPFTYAILRYELLDIRIIAKRAFYYGVLVGIIASFLVFLNFSNQWAQSTYPLLPFWLIPLVSSVGAVGIGVLVWRQLKQQDLVKYEFITTVTHKFRTPLTHIKWATENLLQAQTPEERGEQVGYIKTANEKLVELTNVLANASETEQESYEYKIKPHDLSSLAHELTTSCMRQNIKKHVLVSENIVPDVICLFDVERISFVIQTLIENSLNYSTNRTSITISVTRSGKHAIFSIQDTGIGITKEDMHFLFSKFYRGKEARLTDTEGMGIGLFVSKEIITRHGGKIWAESEGKDKGSTFSFSLPTA